MSPSTERVLETALALPEAERLELTEALVAAQSEADILPFDPAWLPEIQRRSAQIDAGLVTPAAWAEVRDRVRQRLEDRSRG